MPTYGRKDVVFERGEGNDLYAANGRRYWTLPPASLRTRWATATPPGQGSTEQGQKLWHTSNLFRIGNGETLAKRLVDNSFADTMFFCNSGAEAIEGGYQAVRKYQFMNGQPKRYKIICFQAASTAAAERARRHRQREAPLGPGPPAPGLQARAAQQHQRRARHGRRRDRRHPGRADPGRRRHPRHDHAVPARTCARSATSSACCCSTTRSTRASAGPARCGATTGRA